MSRTAAIILAAGASSRFGKPKQLAVLRGETLVRHAVNAANAAACHHVAVVVGEHAAEVQAELAEVKCDVVINPEWRDGLASSIRAGLQHLLTDDHDIDVILLLACDQPLVDGAHLRALIELHESTEKPIVASAYAGTQGIPALFGRTVFHSLLTLTGDRGAKDLILAQPDDVAAIDFPDGAVDIDTASDFERFSENA